MAWLCGIPIVLLGISCFAASRAILTLHKRVTRLERDS